MKIEKVKLSKIKNNPDNPRIIKDDKFFMLVKSIKDFPEMLDIRPIVVNKDMMVLGGNMRLKACLEAGMTEVPIIVADNLTEEQQKEFLIKDNVSGGQFDWDALANTWDNELLLEWGIDMPYFSEETEKENVEFEGFELPSDTFKVTVNFLSQDDKNKFFDTYKIEIEKKLDKGKNTSFWWPNHIGVYETN
jgi:ParB-like chromosome segregation protein Spo0J